jgi:isopentenyl diphosphate isomerase/L-lactate dehydrogenase-like FMN-dependent dehydrogenase
VPGTIAQGLARPRWSAGFVRASSIAALPAVADAVGEDAEVYLGERGARRAIEMMRDEPATAMALMGCSSVQELTRNHVLEVG